MLFLLTTGSLCQTAVYLVLSGTINGGIELRLSGEGE